MKLLRFKIENILALLYIPYAVINTSRANLDFLLVAIIFHLLALIGVLYGTKLMRHELIKEIKEGYYEEELAQIKEAIATFKRIKKTIATALEDIKKEVIGSKLKTTKLKDAF